MSEQAYCPTCHYPLTDGRCEMRHGEYTAETPVRLSLTMSSERTTRADIAMQLRHLADMAEGVTRSVESHGDDIEYEMRLDPIIEEPTPCPN